KDEDEILEAARLKPLRRLHHDMMALAAHDAADNQYNLGAARDAAGIAHRFDAIARHFCRIEALDIDAARHDGNTLPRRAVAVVDQLGELFADRDDPVAARHDAVI